MIFQVLYLFIVLQICVFSRKFFVVKCILFYIAGDGFHRKIDETRDQQ